MNDEMLNKEEIFTLWISEDDCAIPPLVYLSLKSMVLTGHKVIIYTYTNFDNIPDGVEVIDANEIMDKSKIFRYKDTKSFSGFANLFRLKRLYEFGGTWLDLDILLIKNISELDDIIICSEPQKEFYLHTNNAFIRFPKGDPCVKAMLDYAEMRGSDVSHGETGPKLVSKMLNNEFKDYNKYLKSFSLNNLLRWQDLEDYDKSPDELLNKLNREEIYGFHIVNTFFNQVSMDNPEGLFKLLEKSILSSNSPEEYEFNLRKYGILENNEDSDHNYIKELDLKYISTFNDNEKTSKNKEITPFTFLIDVKNLRKVEIYNLIFSIGYNPFEENQYILFGKTDISNDKIKLRNKLAILNSRFEDIFDEIEEFILGQNIIAVSNPVIFKKGYLNDKYLKGDIEHIIEKDNSINIFDKSAFKSLAKIYKENIFDLDLEELNKFNYSIDIKRDEDLAFFYLNQDENINDLIEKIDEIDGIAEMGEIEEINASESDDLFLKIKSEIMELESDLKSENLFDKLSYSYYKDYQNIIGSNSLIEYKLKKNNDALNSQASFYLNKLNLEKYTLK